MMVVAAESPVLGDVGEALTAADLGDVAAHLRSVGDQVTDAGDDLAIVGDKLTSGGQTLVTFAAAKKR